MKASYHETIELASGKGTVSFSAESPEHLREMLYELRDEASKAIVRVEDGLTAQAWIKNEQET